MKDKLIGKTGSALIELLIAMAILLLVFPVVLVVFFGADSFFSDASFASLALRRAHDGLACARIIKNEDWYLLSIGSHGMTFDDQSSGKCAFAGSSDAQGGVTRTIGISLDNDDNKLIISKVSWKIGASATKSLSLFSIVTPLNEGLQGNWKKPRILTSINTGSGSNVTGVAYYQHRLYVSNAASSPSAPDLLIYNVTNSAQPVLLGQLNDGAGFSAIAVLNNYAYAVEKSTSNLLVIDISNPATPVEVARLTLAGGNGTTVAVRDTEVYVGTKNSASGKEFFVIDVTIPNAPTLTSSMEIGSDVNQLDVATGIVSLATSDDLKEMQLIDIADSANPIATGSYDMENKGDGYSVHAKTTDRIYVGRADKDSPRDFFVFDTTDAANIIKDGDKDVHKNLYAIRIVTTLAFIGIADSGHELQIFSILDPTQINKVSELNLLNTPSGIAYHNNYLYIAISNNTTGIQIVTSTP